MTSSKESRWPKKRQVLTQEQERILSDWYQYWLSKEGMQGRYSFVDRFGHEYAAKTFFSGCITVDIGAGNGAHLEYENLDAQLYIALEQRELLAEKIKAIYPKVQVIIADCQEKIDDIDDNYVDRVLAIHVLEHLDNLPSTLKEVHRILKPDGKFVVIIPCEGGWLYRLGRKFSSERVFVNRYHQSHDWLIKYDHINNVREVISEIKENFKIISTSFFPLHLPAIDMELVVGMVCVPIK